MQVPQPHFLVLYELSVLSSAKLALNVLWDIFFEKILHVIRVQQCFDHQTAVTYGSWCSAQVLKEEVHHVLRVPIKLFA